MRILVQAISVVLLATSATISQLDAAAMRNFRVGEWYAGAYSNDRTGLFSHCAGVGNYRSGISVVFSITKEFRWSMSFVNPQWNLPNGRTYSVAFTVDDMSPISATATAISGNHVLVPLDDNVELFNRFRRGHQLRVAAAGQVFAFRLTDTNRLLQSLLECVTLAGKSPAVATNPFESQKQQKSKASPDDAIYRIEATALVANILSLSGIQGFTILGSDQASRLKGHAAWSSSDKAIGTLSVLPGNKDALLKAMPGTIIGRDAASCKGSFLSGSIPDETGASTSRIFTTCQVNDEEPVTAYYLGVPRKKGGIFIFSTVSVGSEMPAKTADTNIRTVVFKALTAN